MAPLRPWAELLSCKVYVNLYTEVWPAPDGVKVPMPLLKLVTVAANALRVPENTVPAETNAAQPPAKDPPVPCCTVRSRYVPSVPAAEPAVVYSLMLAATEP